MDKVQHLLSGMFSVTHWSGRKAAKLKGHRFSSPSSVERPGQASGHPSPPPPLPG